MASGLDSLIHRRPPSWGSQLASNPLKTLAKTLYNVRPKLRLEAQDPALIVVCISDTHNYKPFIPQGHLLIHAGDLTQNGSFSELQEQIDWLKQQPFEYIVVIAGNHELVLDRAKGSLARPRTALDWGDIIYLEESSITLDFTNGRRLKLYGSPWTRGPGNWAFQFKAGDDQFTNKVPDDTDVLVTHSPPKWHRDMDGHGDEFLLHEVLRIKPKLHVFGHVHAGRGLEALTLGRLEEQYRELCAGRQGLWSFVQMLGYWGLEMLGLIGKAGRVVQMVNAAIIGGFRDELRREVTVIRI